LEHHRETVASFLPTCSASHFPVLPFSTNAILILFIFCDSIIHLLTEYNTLMLNAKLHIKSEIAIEISMKFAATAKYLRRLGKTPPRGGGCSLGGAVIIPRRD